MAEKTIGLRLQINGVPQTITNIKQLEETIAGLEGELKGVEIGSTKFNQLSNEIRTARGRLEDFNKSTEGFGFEKLVESVGKFSAGVTSAFATAGAAAQLFGKDSEDVNKAAQKAQNLLTIAIGATSIAEGILAAKKLLTTRATVAETTATVSATVATGGQTAATVALTGAEVAATTATGGLTVAIKALGTAIKSNPIGLIVGLLAAAGAAMYVFSDDTDDATAAIERLDAALKKTLETIDDTTRRTQNDLKIKLAAAEAEGASIEKLSELRRKSIEAERDAAIQRTREINAAYDKEKEILEKNLTDKEKQEEEHKKKLRELDEKYGSQRQAAIVARNNAETNLEIERIQTQQEIRDRELAAQIANQKRRNELLTGALQQRLADLKSTYEQERKAAIKNGEDVLLVDKTYQKRRKEAIKQAQKELEDLTKTVNKELLDVEGRNYQQRIKEVIDFETEKRKQLEKGLDELKKAGVATQSDIDKTNTAIAESFKTQGLKIAAIQDQIFLDYLAAQVNFNDELQKLKLQGFSTDQEIETARNTLFAQNFEDYKKKELEKIKLSLESAGVEQKVIDETLKKYEDYFLKLGVLQTNQAILSRAETKIDEEEKKVQQSNQGKFLQYELELQKKYNRLDKKQLEDYNNEKLALENSYQLNELDEKRRALQARIKLYEQDPTINPEKLQELKNQLLQVEVDYNNKVLEIDQQTTDKKKQNAQDLIANLQTYIGEFEKVLNGIASATAQSFSYQLLALEADYQDNLTRIGDKTEEAIAKRKEAETIYLNQKKQLEKEAQIASLKIQIAQATASAAQSVLSVLAAPPPIGGNPILQGILIAANGIIAAKQIGILVQTIGTVQSMARGGFLRGPSHEQGGIKYQGGGIELEGNEAIINRRSTLQYADLLSQINEQGGGKPIYVNSIMDSRMAEVLASTRNEPIRAYVLEQDITKSQAVNRRLEELASF
jgi:hypothetical protein